MVNQDFYGWNKYSENIKLDPSKWQPCRVITQYNYRYDIATLKGIVSAECSGKLLYSSDDSPVVGDWVLADIVDQSLAVIHEVLPRKTKLSRKAAGKNIAEQVLAANIDLLGIITALDNDYNLNRIERFVATALQSKINPIIILNKTDLAKDLGKIKKEVEGRFNKCPIYFISLLEKDGLGKIEKEMLIPGTTIALVGSSGVGKSTLINYLLKKEIIPTQFVREQDSKGRHTTTNRSLYLLNNKAMIIDNPGIREIGLWQVENGIDKAFEQFGELAKKCKYNNCQHISEPGCEVLAAIENDQISQEQYNNYIKLRKENEHTIRKADKITAHNTKKRWKSISKQIKRDKKEGFY